MLERSFVASSLHALKRQFAHLLARPLWLGIAVVVVTLLAATQVIKLRTEVDLSGLVNPHSAAVEAMNDYEARFGHLTSEETFLLSAPTLADDTRLEALENLLIELQFVEGTEAVLSLHSIPAPGMASSWLTSPEMLALPARERLERMRALNPLAAQILSEDLSATLVVVVPAQGAPGDAFVQDLQDALALAGPGFTIENAGLAEVHRAIGRELIRDLRLLTPAAVFLCMVFTGLIFRSLRAVVVCAAPPIIGLTWFFGWLGWAGIAVDPVMASLPVVLIVLCFSDCMHLYHAAILAARGGGAQPLAVRQALIETMPAAVLTSLTTIVAFATLILPDSPALNAMGQAGVVGIMMCLIAALVASPLLMLLLGAPRPGTAAPRVFVAVVEPVQRVSRWFRFSPVVAAVLLLGLLSIQSQSTIGFRYNEYLPEGAGISVALQRMEVLGLGSDRLFVVVETAPLAADPGTDAPELANVAAAARAVWGQEFDPAIWLDPLRAASVFERLASVDGTAHALPVQLPITAGRGPADGAIRALEARLANAGLADVTRLVGPSHALLTEGPKLIESLRLGLYLTIGSITLLIGLVYRSWRIGLVALVPNLIPIMGVEVWLILTGRDITIMNVIALTVAFGIAVDDTLHMLNRFRLARGIDVHARIEAAIAHAGPPMVATTAILLGGLMVTALSALPGVATYGALIALAVSMALLADLFLLPGLIRWSLK